MPRGGLNLGFPREREGIIVAIRGMLGSQLIALLAVRTDLFFHSQHLGVYCVIPGSFYGVSGFIGHLMPFFIDKQNILKFSSL